MLLRMCSERKTFKGTQLYGGVFGTQEIGPTSTSFKNIPIRFGRRLVAIGGAYVKCSAVLCTMLCGLVQALLRHSQRPPTTRVCTR